MQFRKSGEPFITHPVEVTRILAELKMDYESLIAGLLHDTVEDTENVKFEEIEVRCRPVLHTVQLIMIGSLEAMSAELHRPSRSSTLARRCGRLSRARRASPR